MLIYKTSQYSNKVHAREINLTMDELNAILENKEPIHKIVPHLSKDDREFLITGITPEEWAEMFPGD